MENIKVIIPLEEFEKIRKENEIMRKALDDKSLVIASYHGYKYHIVNADEKLMEIISELQNENSRLSNELNAKKGERKKSWFGTTRSCGRN